MNQPSQTDPDVWLEDALQEYAETRDQTLRDRILERTDWLAARGARRFPDSGEPFDDLLQVARLGLFKALDRFDPKMRVPFGAYATPTVIGELRRHFRDHTWSVHVPRRAKDLRPTVNTALQELSASLGRAPRVEEVAAHLGITAEVVVEALDANAAYRAYSLDPFRSSQVPDPDSSFENSLDRDLVGKLLEHLPARERKVIYLRFYEEQSQAQIAEHIGTSQVHVGRILAASLEKLRRLVDSADVD